MHRYFDVFFTGEHFGIVISCIGVADDAHTRISGQYPLDSFRHGFSSIGYGDLTGVQRVADANSASIVI